MATATASNDTAPPKPRAQESLPGIGIPEVESAARTLRDHRAKRMQMQVEEAELAEKLLATLDEHSLSSFRFEEDGVRFRVKIKGGKRKVSVVKDRDDDDPSEEA